MDGNYIAGRPPSASSGHNLYSTDGYRRLVGSKLPQAAGIILTEPGEEAQVEYGGGPLVRDSQTGKYRRTRLFLLTLGYSRKCVRLLAWRSSACIRAELHEKAVRRLGGCDTSP